MTKFNKLILYFKARMSAINEYLKLNEELEKHGLSAKDTEKVLNLLLNAREYQFDAKKIAGKLRGMNGMRKYELA
jgi:hypothetical protein